ncbi:MAG TPA: hypothetical protein VG501_00880 [Rhizomicrobium sp.]|nr:hypothetical protein [Rhizomicrobium sp.]
MIGFSNGHATLIGRRLGAMNKAIMALEREARRIPARPAARKLMAELKRHRSELKNTARLMKIHERAAAARMKKLGVAGTLSWSAFRAAFAKSKKAFARANKKAGKALRRAVR